METKEDTAFEVAVWQSRCDVVDEMLSTGYVPRKRAIVSACVQRNLDMFIRLLNYPMDAQNTFDTAVKNEFVDALDHLYIVGVVINHADDYGETALHKTGNVKIVKWFLDMGARQTRNSWGETPLHVACRWGRLEIAKVLLFCPDGVDSISTIDNYGNVPMHHACRGHPKLVQLLLSYPGGAQSLLKINTQGCTPAYWACHYVCVETITLLLQVPEGVQSLIMKDHHGNTVLLEACSKHNLEAVKCLLQCPEVLQCINEPNDFGDTCLTVGSDSRIQDLLQTYVK